MRKRWLCWVVVLAGCSPDVSAPDNGADGGVPGRIDAAVYAGPPATLSGTVWAPGNGPGSVPAGQEIPIAGALVSISTTRPFPLPDEVYCEICQDPRGSYAVSDARGAFTITDIRPGEYWLTVEKGQFRRDTQIVLNGGQVLAVPADATTLPSKNDWANGMSIPRVAVAVGAFDYVENILGKMGIGELDSENMYVGASGAGNIDFYENDNVDRYMDAFAQGSVYDLVGDVNLMKQYHIIFLPCSGTKNAQVLADPRVRDNIVEYVRAGGKFYVADWSAEWEDAVWPAFIQFSSGYDTRPGTSQYADADDTNSYTSYASKVVDPDLSAWLNGQQAPLNSGGMLGTINAGNFKIFDNWDHIDALPGVAAVDENGAPITLQAKTWVQGDWGDALFGGTHPLTVTFEPTGCGRVLFTTYHTTGGGHPGLMPQERILLYLIMELGVCKSTPVVQ